MPFKYQQFSSAAGKIQWYYYREARSRKSKDGRRKSVAGFWALVTGVGIQGVDA